MRHPKRCVCRKGWEGLIVLPALFCSTTAGADAFVPFVSLFTPQTAVPALLAMVVIVACETITLKLFFRKVSLWRNLLNAFLINAVSSAVGSLIFWFDASSAIAPWNIWGTIISLFLITFLVEAPLLYFLYRQHALHGEFVLGLSFLLNVVSYAIVLLIELGLLLGFVSYSESLDQKARREWNHLSLVEREKGKIYLSGRKGGADQLECYDVTKRAWIPMEGSPKTDSIVWDAEDGLFAFVDSSSSTLTLCSLPDFAQVDSFSIKTTDETENRNFTLIPDVEISPEKSMVAVLLAYGEVGIPSGPTTTNYIGCRCRLVVYRIADHQLVFIVPGWVSNSGLCWSTDSRTLYYSALTHPEAYTFNTSIRDAEPRYVGQHELGKLMKLGVFSMSLDSTTPVCVADGSCPVFDSASATILFDSSSGLMESSPDTHEVKRLGWGTRLSSKVLSPTGQAILATISHYHPFIESDYIVVMDRNDTSTRLFLGEGDDMHFDWTE